MPFTPPAFIKFRVNTLNLDNKYSTLLGRYKITDAKVGEGTALAQQTNLEILIARTNEVIKCKTERETQREVFNQLVNELRQILKEKDNEEKVKQGTEFLLGALIHRYFRLIKEYDDYNSYAYWTYWGKSDVTNCKLFQAIRKALQLKELDLIKKRFKEEDLKILDVVTIVRSLEVFRDNMLLEDENKNPRYMKYPHFAKDEHFKQYLQDIIDTQTNRGARVLHRFKAIAFVQSLTKEIDKEYQQIEKDMQKWCTGVKKEYKDFAKFRSIKENEELISSSIMKYVESETSRNILSNIFYAPLIIDQLESTDHSTFLIKMKECYEHICSYMLFGGYVLLLLQQKVLDADLLFSIQQALGLEGSLDGLTKKDMLNGIKFLKQFIETEPSSALDCEFFEGKEKMLTSVAQAERELTQSIASTKNTENVSVLT